MKVKVSYTVDFDDVPDLAEEILSSVKHELSDCISKLELNPNNFEKMITDFELVRDRLDITMSQVQDVLHITAGWLQANEAAPDADDLTQGDEDDEKPV
jgi:hypothetical protein